MDALEQDYDDRSDFRFVVVTFLTYDELPSFMAATKQFGARTVMAEAEYLRGSVEQVITKEIN